PLRYARGDGQVSAPGWLARPGAGRPALDHLDSQRPCDRHQRAAQRSHHPGGRPQPRDRARRRLSGRGSAVESRGRSAGHPRGRADWAQERRCAGPVIYLADAAMLVNLRLRDLFERVAAEANIPLQTEVTTGGAEDSAELQRYAAGTPSINFAVATRYLHSHNSMIERADVDRAIQLLVKVLPRLDAKTVAEISRF